MTPNTATAARWAAAVALLIGGLVHIKLYFDGYDKFPNANLGRSFMLNAIVSALVAALLVARSEKIVQLAGIAVAGGTLVAFTLTRATDKGVFGFTEKGMNPSPEALIALVAEIAAIVLLLATLIADRNAPRRTPLAISVVGLVVAAAATIGVGAAAAHTSNTPTTAAAPDATAPTAAASANTTAGTQGAGSSPATGPISTTAAAGSSTGGATPATTASAGTAAAAGGDQAVAIKNFAFAPPALSVKAGTKVTWTNQDSFAHNVTAADKSFVSDPKMSTGASFSYTFAAAGTFTYTCTIHPYMTATVTVT